MIITGAPGTGKTTLQSAIISRLPAHTTGLDYTTRPIRVGESNGVSRHFISEQSFISLLNSGYFIESDLEYAKYNGSYYGTPWDLASPNPPKVSVIPALEIARQLKSRFPEAIWIHLFTNKQLLYERLKNRGESPDSIEYRLNPANSDPGTFEEFYDASISLDTELLSPENLVEIIINFINSLES